MFHSMRRLLTLALAVEATTAAATNYGLMPKRQATVACATGVHLIVAPGCALPCITHGVGKLGTLITNITAAIPGTDQYLIPYTNATYQAKASTPVMTQAATDYIASCPCTPVVFLGYSLGGIIIMNVLSGNLNAALAPNVLAAVMYGEETYTYPEPYDVGTCTNNAPLYPRTDASLAAPFFDSMHSYCDSGDEDCCGGTDPNAHFIYPDIYDVAATNWIKSRYDAWTCPSSTSSSSSSSSTSTSTSASSSSLASTSATTTSTTSTTSASSSTDAPSTTPSTTSASSTTTTVVTSVSTPTTTSPAETTSPSTSTSTTTYTTVITTEGGETTTVVTSESTIVPTTTAAETTAPETTTAAETTAAATTSASTSTTTYTTVISTEGGETTTVVTSESTIAVPPTTAAGTTAAETTPASVSSTTYTTVISTEGGETTTVVVSEATVTPTSTESVSEPISTAPATPTGTTYTYATSSGIPIYSILHSSAPLETTTAAASGTGSGSGSGMTGAGSGTAVSTGTGAAGSPSVTPYTGGASGLYMSWIGTAVGIAAALMLM